MRERKLRAVGIGAALGALAAYFLDLTSGRRRRKLAIDRPRGLMRRSVRRGARAGRAVRAEVYGVAQKATHLREKPKEFDDVTLARKVETEIFRDADVPKGQINVNAYDGVVQLRGEVPTPDMLNDLVDRARRVQGVQEVESLLHLPNTKPRMHQ